MLNRRRALGAACAGFLALVGPGAHADDPDGVEPGARRALAAASAAYHRLGALDQETTYSAEGGGMSRPLKSRLRLQRPNRIFLEIEQQTPDSPKPVTSRFQCDGKTYYIYQQAQGYYTRETAPKDLSGFRAAGQSVEMAAITGADPFDALCKQAKSVRLLSPGVVAETLCEVVALDLTSKDRKIEMRVSIGKDDHLIRKFELNSDPLNAADAAPRKPRVIRDANDDSVVEETGNLVIPPSRFAYENRILALGRLPRTTFDWIAPTGAMEYRPITEGAAPPPAARKRGRKNEPKEPVTIQELLRKARKR